MKTQTLAASISTGVNRHWLDVLAEKQVRYMILDPIHDRMLIEQLRTSPDWIIDFASEEAIIFRCLDASFRNLCKQ